MKIQMVDLTTQYQNIREEIDEAVLNVIRSGVYINGSEIRKFSENLSRYTGAKYVIPCGNGTDALQIACMALGLKPGDEVIVPAFTYIAAVEALGLLGLVPVMADVNPQTFNLDTEEVKKAISGRTKAVIPVHLFGQACDMEPLLEVCRENKLAIIEDNAQSIGAVYTFSDGKQKQTGTIGDIGTLSFFPSKNLGCYGDGGAMLTDTESLARTLQMVASHGQREKYRHEIIGCNSRLDAIQASVLNVKLNYLNQYNEARRETAGMYASGLEGLEDFLTIPTVSSFSTHTYHQYTLKIKNGKRDRLRQWLSDNNIPSMIYYPFPVHHQEAYRKLVKVPSSLSHSEGLCNSVLSLPVHTETDFLQIDYITGIIRSFFRNHG